MVDKSKDAYSATKSALGFDKDDKKKSNKKEVMKFFSLLQFFSVPSFLQGIMIFCICPVMTNPDPVRLLCLSPEMKNTALKKACRCWLRFCLKSMVSNAKSCFLGIPKGNTLTPITKREFVDGII